MHKPFTKDKKGFTIIEVLIVLAIAGLILLIVFLAVPALQRNSRNTTKKAEASAIGGAIAEWANNHNGILPASGAEQTEALTYAKLQTYNGNVTWGAGAQVALPAASVDAAKVVTRAKCNPNGDGSTVAGANRGVAVQYMVETSGAPQAMCYES